MAFCVTCGSQLPDTGRFCTNCGASISLAATGATVATHQPLDYTIQGDNLQVIRIRLQPGQELFAEAGKMLYKQPQVAWETRMSGESLTDKLWGAVKRKLMGESLFLTYFRTSIPGEVGFAGSYPGRIQAFDLKAGQSVFVQRDSFVVAQATAQLNIAMVKRLGAGFFGGEGFILEKLTGPGTVFIHGGGDFLEFPLAAGESLQIDTGSIVAFEEGVDYDIQMVGGIKSALFGGEGLFFATLRGPGTIWLQSLPLSRLAGRITAASPQTGRGGREEGSLLGGIGRLLDGDNS